MMRELNVGLPERSVQPNTWTVDIATEKSQMRDSKMVPHDGIELWSESWGCNDDETVLLVAGANAPASMWPDQLVNQLVREGFRVIRYDHRDTGRSTASDFDQSAYQIADLATDAVAVLDGYDVQRAHVVGLSMGGSLCQLLALDFPERLRTATLMLTTALDVDFASSYARAAAGKRSDSDLPGPSPKVVQQLLKADTPGNTMSTEIERRVEVWRILNGACAEFDAEDFAERERSAINHANTLSPPTNHARATPIPPRRGCELGKIKTPTLVIQGGQDPLNPPPHGEYLAKQIPSAVYIEIPELGHALPAGLISEISHILVEHFRRA
jgi:10-carbomethoxy-13-deoxycarminomycin esterase/esterase